MALVSVTRLHLVSPLYVPAFLWHTALSTWQMINIPGFKGGKLWGNPAGKTGAWTLSIWEDLPAMQHYRNTGAHREVMPFLQKWCDEAAVVHWEQADSSLPDAVSAYRRMVWEGHFTRLSHPSAAQRERILPKPSSHQIKGVTLRPWKKVSSKL